MRFALWASALQTPLDPRRVMAHWNVCRATAYRWIRCYRDAIAEAPE